MIHLSAAVELPRTEKVFKMHSSYKAPRFQLSWSLIAFGIIAMQASIVVAAVVGN